MPSTKQKAKATKASSSAEAASASAGSSRGKVLNRRPILPGHVSPCDSLFMNKLPREIRDKIHEELLVVRMTPKMAEEWGDEIQNGKIYGEYGVERAQDILDQDIALLPGATPNYGSRFIGKRKGILLGNKQIYEEATSILFSKNLFGAFPESDRVWTFWRCDSMGCIPIERPCFVRPEHVSKIKHLLFLVSNPRHHSDRELFKDSDRLCKNVKTIVLTLRQAEAKLKTLKIRYLSCYGGDVESVREELEGPRPPGMPERRVMMRDYFRQKFSTFVRSEAEQRIFLHAKEVLEPLHGMKDIAESVCVRGDMSQPLIDELTEVLAVDGKAALENMRAGGSVEKYKHPTSSKSLAKMSEEEGMSDLYNQLIKTTVKAPSALLFGPPIKEEIDRINAQSRSSRNRATHAANTSALDELSSDDEDSSPPSVNAAASSAIGFIAGKPVFGPPRP